MALTVVQRPVGYYLVITSVTASVSGSSGDALFTSAAHGLSTGGYVYIKSPRSAYNGYWYVEVIGVNTFKIREYATSDFQDYIGSGNVVYDPAFATSSNVWNCVHLPIVYKLKSDKWPINTVDTARTVSSFSNSNGYTQVLLSGDIRASGSADALEQVIISGTASLDGIYKILLWNSDINFVIDLSYSSTNSFAGGTMQYYYGNYHAVIRIYAGLPASHYWASYKPYELVGTIEQEPDPDGIITVNVNEYVKKQINILENNTLLDTLPNNIDAFCYFYISIAESYDDSNQYGTNDLNVTEYVSPYAADSSELVAINAQLPFKTRSSGAMDEYLPTTANDQKFLTTFEEPTLFVGHYFDLSFIIPSTSTYTVQRKLYSASDVLLATVNDVVTNMQQGVYRYPIERSANLEAYMTVQITSPITSELLTINIDATCSPQDFYVTWLNSVGGYDYWNFKAETVYTTDTIESKTQEKNIFPNWPKSFGEFSDSRTKQTVRRTKDGVTLNSQYLESEQMDGLALIFESPLVQEMNSIYDRRTIILEGGTFNNKVDNQKLLMVTVKARYTDENPSQSL